MLDRRHVNEIAARQSDMRCNTSTLFGDRFFGDLDENFLSFFKEVRDRRLRPTAAPIIAVVAVTPAVSRRPVTGLPVTILAITRLPVTILAVIGRTVFTWAVTARTVTAWAIATRTIVAASAATASAIAASGAVIDWAFTFVARFLDSFMLLLGLTLVSNSFKWGFGHFDDLVAAVSLIGFLILYVFFAALFSLCFSAPAPPTAAASHRHFGARVRFLVAGFGVLEVVALDALFGFWFGEFTFPSGRSFCGFFRFRRGALVFGFGPGLGFAAALCGSRSFLVFVGNTFEAARVAADLGQQGPDLSNRRALHIEFDGPHPVDYRFLDIRLLEH